MTGPEDLGKLVESLIQQLQAAQHTQAALAGVSMVQTMANMCVVTHKSPAEIVKLYNDCAVALKDLKVK